MKKFFLSLLCLGALVLSCNKNDDSPIIEEEVIETPVEETPVEVDIEVQNFFWQTLNSYYFWQGEVTDLADDRFDTQAAYEAYLKDNSDPVALLENKLLFSEDRFTFYDEDYRNLVNGSAGISKSNGLEFGLSLIGDSDDIFGYVEYIIKNSDAASKDIKRGDIFIGVNGTRLNRNNYIDLLFGENNTYTLNMAEITNSTISPIDKEITLTKQEGLQEDPILTFNIITSGNQKIGYNVSTNLVLLFVRYATFFAISKNTSKYKCP